MPYLRAFRALCEGCERTEAVLWCVPESKAFCVTCDAQHHNSAQALACSDAPHERVSIAAQSVLSPICDRCKVKLSAAINPARHECLCEDCSAIPTNAHSLSSKARTSSVPAAHPMSTRDYELDETSNNAHPMAPLVSLKASGVANSAVFDKMDFSAGVAMRGAKRVRSRRSAKLVLAGLGGPESTKSRVGRWLEDEPLNVEDFTPADTQQDDPSSTLPEDKSNSAPTRGLSTNSGTASDKRHSENPPGPDPGGTGVLIPTENPALQARHPTSLDLSYFATEVPINLVSPGDLAFSPTSKRKSLASAGMAASPHARRKTTDRNQ